MRVGSGLPGAGQGRDHKQVRQGVRRGVEEGQEVDPRDLRGPGLEPTRTTVLAHCPLTPGECVTLSLDSARTARL